MRRGVTAVNAKEILLENILALMSSENFSKELLAKIVGGVKKLEALIVAGEIEVTKPNSARNGKWRCNAAQVLRHCRNMRK